jgi:hypothetical protein
MPDEHPSINIQSLFGANSRRGLVELTVGDTKTTLDTAKAREVAQMLLEAASAAEGDEALFKSLELMGASLTKIASIVQACRQERDVIQRQTRKEILEAILHDQANMGD